MTQHLERILVHPSRRFLMTESGMPFFWLADTAWELIHRCSREEIDFYLRTRSQQGFNVIQTVVLAEMDGLRTPNVEGHLPLNAEDPTQPNEQYFGLVDFVIERAAEYGLYVALLPTWGDKVAVMWGKGPVVFNDQNAYQYAEFMAQRYASATNLIWMLGGDRPMRHEENDWRSVWRAMALGIRSVLGAQALITYHPTGDRSLADGAVLAHAEDWVDLVTFQSGHSARNTPCWEMMDELYSRVPSKPVLDAEPNYEDHPVAPWPVWNPENGYFRDEDVRRSLYRSVFAGGCGVTYGHHFIWQFYAPGRAAVNGGNELIPWREAILRPAAKQARYLKELMLSHPFFTRRPCQGLLASSPGEGGEHVRACRDTQGMWGMVYFPCAGQAVELNLSKLTVPLKASWFNPRTGAATEAGQYSCDTVQLFTSPLEDGPDWVLVLDTIR